MTAPIVAAPARSDGYALMVEHGPAAWHFADLPARHLARRGLYVDVLHLDVALERERIPMIPPHASVLLDYSVGCTMDPAAMRRLGGRVLFIVDDDWWSPTAWNPIRPALADMVRQLEPRLRGADAIVVPTPRLAERCQRFAVPTHLIPLALPPLDELPASRPRRDPSGVRIGWSGTWTHAGDLGVLGPAVLELLTRRPDVTFVLAGRCFPAWTDRHPQIERHPGAVHLPAYYTWLRSLDLDVFLCPLASGQAWNEAKPCLKPLEACGLGIPVIASRVGAYAAELVHEETALVVENSREAWSAALTRLVNDAELRAHLAEGGRAWAGRNTIEATGDLWAKLWGHTTHERKED